MKLSLTSIKYVIDLNSKSHQCSVRLHFRHSMASIARCWSSTASSRRNMQYQLSRLDDVEDVEKYRLGGFHPIHLADTFKDGKYQVLQKLGYGGFSTVWLARDRHLHRLVSLKVITAEASHQQRELKMLRHVDGRTNGDARRKSIVSILDSFSFDGPNGHHLCYVSPVGGPSIARLSDSPGQVSGSRRLRAPLARKLAGQLADAVAFLHSLGVVHGGQSSIRNCWNRCLKLMQI